MFFTFDHMLEVLIQKLMLKLVNKSLTGEDLTPDTERDALSSIVLLERRRISLLELLNYPLHSQLYRCVTERTFPHK